MERGYDSGSGDFAQRVLVVVAISATTAILLVLAWTIREVLLLTFAGILLAIFLRAPAEFLAARTGLRMRWSLALVIIALFAGICVVGYQFGPALVGHIGALSQGFAHALSGARDYLDQFSWARELMRRMAQSFHPGSGTLSRVTGIFSTLLGGAVATLVILIVGIYLSIEPDLYLNGALRLIPPRRRARARQVIGQLGHALRWWLVGRLSSMTVIGVMTWFGLWALGIPLAVPLALLAALLTFIPNIGPVLSALPAVLIGFEQGFMMAAYVALLYFAVQQVESYLITPVIQRHAVAMPPVLLLTVQLAMGLLAGVMGLVMATPLTVAMMVLIDMLYVQDVLGDRVEPP